VAIAAVGAGDRPTADEAWRQLVHTHHVITSASVARLTAADVAGRDTVDPHGAVEPVAVAVANLHSLDTPVHEDPGPVLAAADALHERGDLAGARLLLHAARRRIPPTPALDAALRHLTPVPAMNRHRGLVVALWCLAPTVLWLGPVGGLIIGAVRRTWERWVRIPGLGVADSVAWRAFRSVRYDPHTDPNEPAPKDQSGYYGLAGLFCILSLAIVADGMAPTVAGVSGAAGPTARHGLMTAIWVALIFGSGAGGYLLARYAHRRLRARGADRRRAAALRHRIAAAGNCRCWRTDILTGSFANAYLKTHLTREPVDDLPPSLAEGSSLGRCGTTGTLWLGPPAGPGSAVLLRGLAAEDEADPDEDRERTGFYL
jgi:hypothetical protein